MSLGLIGKKIGMTRIFSEDGRAIPVTVIDVSGNELLQRKTVEVDGYAAAQVSYDTQKDQRLNKPQKGHFKKYGGTSKKRIQEFRLEEGEIVPEELKPSHFQNDQWVDVIGVTKGKGFQGVYKRYNYGGLPETHGSMMHRRPGGIGCGTTPGRVWKNAQMPGRHGNYRRTVQNLRIVQVREDDGVILISGAVPGAIGSYVTVRPAKKKPLPAIS